MASGLLFASIASNDTRFSLNIQFVFNKLEINPFKEETETLGVRGVLNEFAYVIARKRLNDSLRILKSSRPKKEVGPDFHVTACDPSDIKGKPHETRRASPSTLPEMY